MAHYAIGDLQGCYAELNALLNTLEFNHGKDTLWLVGDVVNRGPQSLECLQFVLQHSDSVQMVLGNHDLHLLALLYGHGKHKKSDSLTPILNHPQAKIMRDFLRQQPLMYHNTQYVLVHAGILPQWTVAQAQDLANEVSHELTHSHVNDFVAQMYGNQPNAWSEDLVAYARWRFITNVFTRMRVLNPDNSLDYAYKGVYGTIPKPQYAWFDAPQRLNTSHTIVFGHWSALGLCQKNHVIGIDTGALWGGVLTAINLDTGELTSQESFQTYHLK